jgi:hypothetical protein
MVEINFNPSSKDVRIFGLLFLLFFAGVGAIVLWKPQALVGASMILGTAWILSLIFNSQNRAAQLAGVFIPGLFVLSGGAVVRAGVPAQNVALALSAMGLVGALLVWAAPGLGKKMYIGWMTAAAPIGWTISHFVLGLVYYVVLTPIGLVMKLFGYDPMTRKIDRRAATYWVERPPQRDAASYFRQF